MINTRSGMKEERYFCFKVFSYTSADHKRRFERCPYSKEEYAARRESAFAVKEAFATGSVQKLNALTDEKEITGDGYLFVCAPLDELNLILAHLFPGSILQKTAIPIAWLLFPIDRWKNLFICMNPCLIILS